MISRNSSGPLTQKVNMENLYASMSQKDKIIMILQKQLQGFRDIRQNYDRLKDRKNQLLDKCQVLARQININRGNQDVRVDNNHKYISELRMLVTNLQNQLQNKQYHLRDLKYEAENLIKSSQQRQNDLLQSGQSIETIKSSTEVLKMESTRLFAQISQIKEQIQRIRQYQIQSEAARQKIKSQIINTQTFIRQLGYEQSRHSQTLQNLEDHNNSIDQIIEDLKKVCQMTKIKIREIKDEKQQHLLKIKTRQLQKGRTQTQHNERIKQFRVQREKQKNLKQMLQAKKSEIQRLAILLKQVNEQSENIMKDNVQVQGINIKLEKDLSTCRKHQQNVIKINSSIKQRIQNYYKINIKAINKLKKPLDEGWIQLGSEDAGKRDFGNLQTAEGFEKSI